MSGAVAAVGSVVSGVMSFKQQKKAAKAQKNAMAEQQRMQEVADARDRRRALRQANIARGETVNIGAQFGAMGSSALAGGLSGLNNQVQGQLGFQNTGLASSQYITSQNIAAAKAMSKASQYDMFGSFFRSLPGVLSSFGGSSQSISSPYPTLLG